MIHPLILVGNSPIQDQWNIYAARMWQRCGITGAVTTSRINEATEKFARVALFRIPAELNQLNAWALSDESFNCYVKTNLFNYEKLVQRYWGTGNKKEIEQFIAFHLELDVASKDPRYPTREALLAYVYSLPFPPTLIINSDGPHGGLYLYWCVHPVDAQAFAEVLRSMTRRLFALFNNHFEPQGLKVDANHDRCRVLRLIGSKRKSGKTVSLFAYSDNIYTLADIEQYLPPDGPVDAPDEYNRTNSPIEQYMEENDITVASICRTLGWTESAVSGLWTRPESTSGAPTGQEYYSRDGRPGYTSKTAGEILTLATDPVTGERLTIKLEALKWYNAAAFWVAMTQGALDPDAWKRASKVLHFARRGENLDVIPPTLTLPPPKQRSASNEQMKCAEHEMQAARSGANRLWRMARIAVEVGLSDQQAWNMISGQDDFTSPIKDPDPQQGIVKLQLHELIDTLRQIELSTTRGCRSLPGAIIRESTDPQEIALRVMAEYYGWMYDDPQRCRLRYWAERWYEHNGKCYTPQTNDDIETTLHDQAKKVVNRIAEGMQNWYLAALKRGETVKPPKFPKFGIEAFSEMVRIIKGQHLLKGITIPHIEPGSELTEYVTDPNNVISFENGIGEIDTRIGHASIIERQRIGNVRERLFPHDTRFISLGSLPFKYNPDATCPVYDGSVQRYFWYRGVRDLESEFLWDEWGGYNLVVDKRFDKILALSGPPRSGKTTLITRLEDVQGEWNVVNPQVDHFQQQFGLEQLMFARSIIVNESRLGGRDNTQKITSLLLGISGRDRTSVARKFRENAQTRIPGRITLVSNEVITLSDESGAFPKRLLLLKTRESFYGREDITMEAQMRQEQAGIFNRMVRGLQRLYANRKFTEPSSTAELRKRIESACAPTQAFIEDICILDRNQTVEKKLFHRWHIAWADHNRSPVIAENRMGSKLGTALEALKGYELGSTENHPRHWVGIGLKPELIGQDPNMYFRLPSVAAQFDN